MISLLNAEQQRRSLYNFINQYIEYKPYRNIIYPKCYPTNNVVYHPKPAIGWDKAYSIAEKFYFDEIFFHLHMHVAMNARDDDSIYPRSKSSKCSKNVSYFASKCNVTSLLMDVLSVELKGYLNPKELYK